MAAELAARVAGCLEFVFRILAGEQAEAGIDEFRGVRADDDKDSVWRQDTDYFPSGRAYVGDEFKAAYANNDIEVSGGERHVFGIPQCRRACTPRCARARATSW